MGVSEAFGKLQISEIEKIFVIFGRILSKKNFQDHQIIFQVELPQGTCNPRENYLISERSFLTVFLPVETLYIGYPGYPMYFTISNLYLEQGQG